MRRSDKKLGDSPVLQEATGLDVQVLSHEAQCYTQENRRKHQKVVLQKPTEEKEKERKRGTDRDGEGERATEKEKKEEEGSSRT